MEEIKVGEYVRTREGYIGKLINIDEKAWNYLTIDVKIRIRHDEFPETYLYLKNEDIVKHSSNIMDLIEYGDLVKFKDKIHVTTLKGQELDIRFLDAMFCNGWSEDKMIIGLDYLVDKDQADKIEWILTHEQIYRENYEV